MVGPIGKLKFKKCNRFGAGQAVRTSWAAKLTCTQRGQLRLSTRKLRWGWGPHYACQTSEILRALGSSGLAADNEMLQGNEAAAGLDETPVAGVVETLGPVLGDELGPEPDEVLLSPEVDDTLGPVPLCRL